MKKLNIIALAILSCLINVSCKKNNIDSNNAANISTKKTRGYYINQNMFENIAQYEQLRAQFDNDGVDIDKICVNYFLNGQVASSNIQYENYYFTCESTKNLIDRSGTITINAFSTISSLIEYANTKNVDVSKAIEFGESMHNYAVDNGYDNIDYESEDDLPIDYINKENEEFQKLFKKTRGIYYDYYDDFVPYGAKKTIVLSTFPVLVKSWRNRFSGSIGYTLLTAQGSYFDGNFYGSYLGSTFHWAFSFLPYHSSFGTAYLSNKINSGINL